MSTVNDSMAMAPFQIRFGRMPRMLPPLVCDSATDEVPQLDRVCKIVTDLHNTVAKAHDALLEAKVVQSAAANRTCGPERPYNVGDLVMLRTANRRRNLKRQGQRRAAKLLP